MFVNCSKDLAVFLSVFGLPSGDHALILCLFVLNP